MQHMRVAGSGAVSPRDLTYAWADLVASCVAEMVLKRNFRVGSRGLVDSRSRAHTLGPLSTPHGSAISHNGATQVISQPPFYPPRPAITGCGCAGLVMIMSESARPSQEGALITCNVLHDGVTLRSSRCSHGDFQWQHLKPAVHHTPTVPLVLMLRLSSSNSGEQ